MPFLRALAARGVRSAIERLKAVPEPYPDVSDAISAFAVLTQGRPYGMNGPLPIPLSEIAAFASLYHVPDIDRLVRLVRALDRAHLKESYVRDDTEGRNRRERGKTRSPRAR